ncbi:unnamed protein product [Fraxinus pennsylvanica]|uniref:Uncharacterized protein n=1 Tax=Fraxinus pennsylvanica TaxID=56036 RepID=A0AAD1Z7C3_9LAMI|nr:unnamed protein product [Fraxinus pennsylvanica]
MMFVQSLVCCNSYSTWQIILDVGLRNGNESALQKLLPRRTVTDGYLGYDKDALKQKILEHEAIFKNQVYELHRLYRTQRNMMEEIKKNELCKHQTMMEPSSSSSSLHGSQIPSEDARKQQMTGFPLLHSGHGRTSVSGVEIVNSPLSCTNENNKHTGHILFHHGCSSKETEALDLRPSKVRKKLFDLQLPADQYVDTEDEECIQDRKASGILSCTPNGVQKVATNSSKFFISGDASASNSCLRRSIGLADLNEPIPIEEVMPPSSTDFLGCTSNVGETKGVDLSAKPSAGFVRVLGETIYSHNRSLINSSIGSEVKERGWLNHVHEAGSSKSNPTSALQGLPKENLHIPSQPADVMLSQVCHPPGKCPTGHSREDLWRERSHDHSNNNHSEPVVASRIPGPSSFSGFADSWSHFHSSSAKPTSCFIQKITSLPTSINSASTSQETFGDKWKVNASSRLNLNLGSDVTSQNGFYHGPVSGSKELRIHLPSDAIDYFNRSKGDNVASDHSANHGYEKFLKGSSHVDRKCAVDIDLNEVVLKSSSIVTSCLQDLNKMDEKSKHADLSTWPWLKPKPSYRNEAATGARSSELSGSLAYVQASSNPPCCKSETVRDLNQTFPPNAISASSDCEVVTIHETRNIKKILGFPIFEFPSVHKNEPASHVSTSGILPSEGKISKNKRRNGIIDINVACESDEQIAAELIIEKEIYTKGNCTRNLIDLNSCINDDEDPPVSSVPSNSAITKTSVEIDLEAPVILEIEDDNAPSRENIQVQASLLSSEHRAKQIQDEIVRNAAQTIIAISSSSQKILAADIIFCPPDALFAEPLLWFVDVISTHADKLKGKESRCRNGASIRDLFEEMDDFEAMTLQLTEMKEYYMPKPFVPEVKKMEEIVPDSLPNRSRRGPPRRGRQRRDFQRDILPGLTSLSRHEVTEDLQTFGGLMRATGHPWNSGLMRRNSTRNGGARVRQRTVVETTPTIPTPVCNSLMQQLNNIEAGLEDRSITGWGKTTRRPRRQRCPAGSCSGARNVGLSGGDVLGRHCLFKLDTGGWFVNRKKVGVFLKDGVAGLVTAPPFFDSTSSSDNPWSYKRRRLTRNCDMPEILTELRPLRHFPKEIDCDVIWNDGVWEPGEEELIEGSRGRRRGR